MLRFTRLLRVFQLVEQRVLVTQKFPRGASRIPISSSTTNMFAINVPKPYHDHFNLLFFFSEAFSDQARNQILGIQIPVLTLTTKIEDFCTVCISAILNIDLAPCSSTIFLTIARPRPVPLGFDVA